MMTSVSSCMCHSGPRAARAGMGAVRSGQSWMISRAFLPHPTSRRHAQVMVRQWFDLMQGLAYDAGVQACPDAEETAFMPLFRAGRTAAAAAILGMLATPAFAQKRDDKKDDKKTDQTKFTDAQRQELLPVIR